VAALDGTDSDRELGRPTAAWLQRSSTGREKELNGRDWTPLVAAEGVVVLVVEVT